MRGLFRLYSFGALVLCVRGNGIIHRAHKAIQGDDCRPRRSSWLRSPWLTPIRNPFELRGLYRRSYFGPRTCGGGITNVIEVDGTLNQGFPFCDLDQAIFVAFGVWSIDFAVTLASTGPRKLFR